MTTRTNRTLAPHTFETSRMLSRVAGSIYWISRYVERAENLARFIDVTFSFILDSPQNVREQWQPLISTTADDAIFAERYGTASRENAIRFLAFDSQYPNSILSCLSIARENARSIRESISTEMWEQLNGFYHNVVAATRHPGILDSPQDFCQEVRSASQLFKGVTDATMSHGEGWHFARLGRMLERADKTSRILDVKYYMLLPAINDVGTPTDDLQWSAVLRSVSGFEMFRKRHGIITPQKIVGFLVLDRLFPRAIMHCIDSANQSLHAIVGSPEDTFWNPAEKELGQLRSALAYSDTNEILRHGLHEFLDSLQAQVNQVGAAIFQTFFAVETDNRS
jgi:uncharacterized alpha-E superfamily protein